MVKGTWVGGEIVLKAYGYIGNSEEMVELKELTIKCDIDEIDKMISFLKITKQRHEYFADSGEVAHTHYRDWDKEWESEELDVIITTDYENDNE